MTTAYITEVGVTIVVVCALIAAILGWHVSRRFTSRLAYRSCIASVVGLITIAAMTSDVAHTSLKAAKLCPQVGVYVKRPVRVEGFYIEYGAPDLLNLGLKYLERKGSAGQIIVYSKDGDAIKAEEFDSGKYQIKSRYEFISASGVAFDERRDIGVYKSVVRDRQTGEEIGYALAFTIFPGWVDRKTIGLLTKTIWVCPDDNRDLESDLRIQTFLPQINAKSAP